MLFRSRNLLALLLLTGLPSLVCSQLEFGCQAAAYTCSGHGICEKSGYCTCHIGFVGEKCEVRSPRGLKREGLGKNFVTFWVLFWVLLNLSLPLLFFCAVQYCQAKNCKPVAELCKVALEAVCCCFSFEKKSDSNLSDSKAAELPKADAPVAVDAEEKKLSINQVMPQSEPRVNKQATPADVEAPEAGNSSQIASVAVRPKSKRLSAVEAGGNPASEHNSLLSVGQKEAEAD